MCPCVRDNITLLWLLKLLLQSVVLMLLVVTLQYLLLLNVTKSMLNLQYRTRADDVLICSCFLGRPSSNALFDGLQAKQPNLQLFGARVRSGLLLELYSVFLQRCVPCKLHPWAEEPL